MRYFRLSFLALVLFFGTAYGQKRAISKPVREEVIYKNIDFVDKEAVFSKGGETGFRELLASNTDLDKIDRYEGFSEEKKKEIQELVSEKKPVPPVLLSTRLTFVVEPNGTLSNVLAKGENQSFNKEMERVALSINAKWIPAEVKGEKVRSKYYVPVKITVE
jgi:tonB family protein